LEGDWTPRGGDVSYDELGRSTDPGEGKTKVWGEVSLGAHIKRKEKKRKKEKPEKKGMTYKKRGCPEWPEGTRE